MKKRLPVVMTRGLVLFPTRNVVIEVGREKSLAALDYAKDNTDNEVLIISQKKPAVNDPKIEDLYEIGTIARIDEQQNLRSFRRVSFTGKTRAKLLSETVVEENKAVLAEVEELSDTYNDDEISVLAKTVVDAFTRISSKKRGDEQKALSLLSEIEKDELSLANALPSYYTFGYKNNQKLLEISDLNERLYQMLAIMSEDEYEEELENKINDKVRERMEENQKEFFLREKMRAIKEELGDVKDGVSEVDKYRQRINDDPYPEHVKEKALEELARYELLPASSGESGVVKSYIDWLLNIPWWQESEDNNDLKQAQAVLDADHYGLEKAKERILEYLAVKQMTNSLKAPIICLVGPPGVGKTSIAKSVAKALNREFVKISLGGVKDESEIRGHRRTYLGSMPGRFIQAMKKAGTINPVILIDEIDKMASDYKGDPASAMLEVLDPEQNEYFSDHYLEEPYDLSKVLFIATANYMENIPEALKDRLEIIQLSSYTELEKLEIAKKHLVPKQLEANGLKASQFKISDDVLLYLIRYYTREAGVRQLERLIGTLCRKRVLAILKDDKKSPNISKKLIKEYLGNEKVDYGKKEDKHQVGVVTGLAYTNFGGDILQVEVTKFKGNGKLIITGQLGDVMKESASIAYDYVKANAKKYGIDEDQFKDVDVHIHVPEGAVPKDGPSAGVTLTTALVSCFSNKPVENNLAMTGEVTLRGNVLPIGGLKEKSLAAHRSGITKILIPEGNKKDIDELSDVVKENITIIPVSTVDEVLKEALK